jgi:competence protein ComEC
VTRIPAPHLVAGAFCTGLGLALALRATSVAVPAAAAVLSVVALTERRQRALVLAAALLLAGWWWGSTRLDALDRSVLARHAGDTGRALVEVTGPARTSEFSVRVPVKVLRFGSLEPGERSRLELPPSRAPPQGAVLETIATVRLPRHADETGGFDEAGYLNRQGVHAVLRADRYRLIGRRGGAAALADRLRAALARSLAPGLTGERKAVVAGIVVGEDEGLDADLRDSFRASGLYHLLAVSGQNVAYVIGGVIALAWLVGLSRRVGEACALTAVAAYVVAVGWQPSVVRAGVAGGLASLAWLASRPRDRWYFLLVGAAVLLAWTPYALLEPGFQLSFGAVGAIFLLVPPIERRLSGYPIPVGLRSILAVSVACGVATAPILMTHFGAVPLFSVAANAAAAPVVAPLLGLGLGAAALDPVLPEAALALAWVNGWLAAYLAGCARLFGGLPHAQLTSWSGLAALVAVAGVVALVLRIRAPRGRRVAALAGLVCVLAGAWTLRPERALPPPEGLRLTVLDVGQGDATLLEVREGAILVDQGPPEADVAGQLLRMGVRRLAALVLTHPSRDNIGGARDVVERLDVDLVLEPALPFPNPYGRPALAEARRRGIPVEVTRAGRTLTLGRLRLQVLWPEEGASANDDPNDHTSVLLATYGEVDALLPADAESNVTLQLRPPPVELVKVAHHGSADPGLGELLALVRPRLALVSVGARNDYGHPTPSTLAALASFPGLSVYRTDEDGRITIETDGRRISVREER